MDFRQLLYFVTAVEEGSISAAARKLVLSQPPVTAQIKALEEELGCTLLVRGARAVRMTEEGRLLYDRAKAEFDARMEEIAALPPKEILNHAYEKVIKEEFLGELEQGLDEWETDTLLTYPQPLAALYTEWMDNDFSFWDSIRGTVEKTVEKQAADLRRCAFHVNGEPPVEMKDFYDLHGDELNDTGLEPAGEVER